MEIITCNIIILTQLFGMLTSLAVASFLAVLYPEVAWASAGAAAICASGAAFALAARGERARAKGD